MLVLAAFVAVMILVAVNASKKLRRTGNVSVISGS